MFEVYWVLKPFSHFIGTVINVLARSILSFGLDSFSIACWLVYIDDPV